MDKKLRNKWIKALRSGKYKQTREGFLKYEKEGKKPEYCCLGVLACLIDDKAWKGDYWKRKMSQRFTPHWLKKIGLDENHQNHLIDMNDGDDWADKPVKPASFKRIANWIEKHL